MGSTCTFNGTTAALPTECVKIDTYPIPPGGNRIAFLWTYGYVTFSGDDGDDNKLTTLEIAGISAGAAVGAVGIAAAAYYLMGQGAASGAGAASSGAAANPMVSAV